MRLVAIGLAGCLVAGQASAIEITAWLPVPGEAPCSMTEFATEISDDIFVTNGLHGCTARVSPWRQDGAWTAAEFSECIGADDEPAPDQTGRFRFVTDGSGPAMVEFSLFPEDGVLRAHICEVR
jgi:hypothetical protein